MGSYIAKQPNGLYCRFSDVVDTVTDYNMTEDEYIEICVERAKKRAIEDAKYTLKHCVCPFEKIKEDFFPNNNTIEEFEELLHKMGDEEGLGEKRKLELLSELKEMEEDE